MQAEDKGLQAQKEDSFNQITQGANRRGLLFSGIPLQEQAEYVGQSYLPAVANLKAKYAQQRFNLQDALAKIGQEQYQSAYGIYNNELAMDEAARARAGSGGGGGGVPSFGASFGTIGAKQATPAPQTLRQTWQVEANAGDADAQVALNYAGDDGRYDGAVRTPAEYAALRRLGIQGNYYIPGLSGGTGGSGLTQLSSGGKGGW